MQVRFMIETPILCITFIPLLYQPEQESINSTGRPSFPSKLALSFHLMGNREEGSLFSSIGYCFQAGWTMDVCKSLSSTTGQDKEESIDTQKLWNVQLWVTKDIYLRGIGIHLTGLIFRGWRWKWLLTNIALCRTVLYDLQQ